MNLNWLESAIYGLFSGLADILPVSAQAHRMLVLKLFGIKGSMDLLNLFIHIGVAAAIYIHSQTHLVRMSRAQRLAHIPKKKRKRPLDIRSMMDLSMLKTMLVPVIVGLFLSRYTETLHSNLMMLSLFLLINGVVLYVPQYLPTGNKDSRTLSRVEGLLMGLGGAVSIVPGFSAMGVSTAIGSVCGVDRSYCLSMALMMNLFLNIGLAILDVMGIMSNGVGEVSAVILLRYLLTAAIAFMGSMLGIKLMNRLAQNDGDAPFGFYCFGLALFIFILNLMA